MFLGNIAIPTHPLSLSIVEGEDFVSTRPDPFTIVKEDAVEIFTEKAMNSPTSVLPEQGIAKKPVVPAKKVEQAQGVQPEHTETRVHIRWMIRRDMQEVLHTEQECFHVPWTEDDFCHCLRQRNCIGMVAECGNSVIGHVLYELHRNRLHILNLAVHPTHWRHHVGSQIMAKLIGKLSSHRRARITLELRESNLVAQLFLKALGFVAAKLVKNYYEDTNEDAYFMEYRLPDYDELSEDGFKPVNRISKY